MLKFCIFLVYFGVVSFLQAQKHDYVWKSGINTTVTIDSTVFAIDFLNDLNPNLYKTPDSLLLGQANITISDSSGNILFYSNGCLVRNRTGQTMDSGGGINLGTDPSVYYIKCGPLGLGAYPVVQGLFSLPLLGNKYGLFYIQFDEISNPWPNSMCKHNAFQYAIINMDDNQGLGKVEIKDSILLEGCFQVAVANKHANGRDWWILLADNTIGRFYRFLQTAEGIQGPWYQDIENLTTTDTFFYAGWTEFSPDGNRLMINDVQTGVSLYHFDRCTGLLSSPEFLPANYLANGHGYGAAFSPDSKRLYVVRGALKRLEQYDLTSTNIELSKTTVAVWDGAADTLMPSGSLYSTFFSYFQHGPDGRLYNWAGGSRYMHVVNFPNRIGTASEVKQRGLRLLNYTTGANAYYPNYRLGPVDGSACDTLGIDNMPVALFRHDWEDSSLVLQRTFTDLSYYEPAVWSWDFGDGFVSADTSPVHAFSQAGTYNVCLTVSNPNGIDTYCREVTVGTTSLQVPVLPKLEVAPNPASETIRFILPNVSGQLLLMDVQGRTVREQSFENRAEMDVRQLVPGLYFYKLAGVRDGIWSGKVVIQR
ncbi:MAG: T9SS type A sorting domain-containing protein [Saprospiraceae bacterium]|nr:T9SS type A sorting domain-containing protein [Saprospiraceae bacterium]